DGLDEAAVDRLRTFEDCGRNRRVLEVEEHAIRILDAVTGELHFATELDRDALTVRQRRCRHALDRDWSGGLAARGGIFGRGGHRRWSRGLVPGCRRGR